MSQSSEVKKKVRASDRVVRDYVRGLEAENTKLHRQIVRLEIKNLSQENRITALEKIQKEPQEIIVKWGEPPDAEKKA
jgi:hypothetical protein